MRTTPSPAASARRTPSRALKAVLSLLVLAAAVAGLPLLLTWVTPVIWAASHDDLTHLLDRQDTGAAFLLLLVCVGWIGWAQFTFCTIRELIAQLGGRAWHAPRGLGAPQRAAALLIGSILVLLPTSSALAFDAQAAPAATAARLPGQSHTPQAAGTERAAAPATSAPASPTYTVRETRPAESLWSIAERELGDGERWREIASLNEGRTMADGEVFRANSFLQPGWQLRMPASGASAEGVRTQLGDSAPTASEEKEHVVTVRSGDYLSKIAEEELGDGDAWPALFEASRGKPQPDGLPEITDPDRVYPGQHVTVPGTHTGRHDQTQDTGRAGDGHADDSGSRPHTPPASGNPHDHRQDEGPSESKQPTPAPSQSHGSASASAAPRAQPSHEQVPPASSRPSASASAPASPAASTPGSSSPAAAGSPAPTLQPGNPLHLRTVLGAAALLAAAVTAALAVRRMLQRRRRKPGETIAIAAQTAPAEAQLAAAAEPGGADRLDVALRTLAHRAAQDGTGQAPGLRAARISQRCLEVLPEDLTQAPLAPFVQGQAGWWTLPSSARLLDEDAARYVLPPCPGLVTIGSTEAGDLLLVNLARLPALLLDGIPAHITEVCTSLAIELGMSPWAGAAEVIAVGFGPDLPQLLPTSRIMHMRHAAHALRDLTERLLEAHQMPESSHQPYLLLCAAALDADTAWQLADAIDKASIPVTLVAPAPSAAAHFPDAELLNADLDEPQHLDCAGTDILLQRLEHAAYQQITTALALSAQPAAPAEGPWQSVPGEPDSAQQPTPPSAQLPVPHSAEPPAAGLPRPDTAESGAGEVFPALVAAASSDPAHVPLPAHPSANEANETEEASGAQENSPHHAPHTDAVPAPAPAPAAPTAPGAADAGHPAADSEAHTTESCTAQDLHAPEIKVLGPLEVTGVQHTGHGPRLSQLAALMYFRPGRGADALCADMDPLSPWSASTLNARLQGLRRALGNDPAGNPYVPRRSCGEDPYRLSDRVRCDWTRFLQLAERALPLGPAGLPDLEKALDLVRGRPFGNRPLPWAEPHQQEMITRITDVAHTVATYRTPAGPHHDLSAARQAVATGLDADDSAELLYRDWMRIEHAAGNRSGLHTAITRIQHVNQVLDCSLETETEQLITQLLHPTTPHRTLVGSGEA